MAPLRFSIAGLMALVLCLAVNLAMIRFLLGFTPALLAGVVVTAPLLQVGVWRLVRGSGRSSAFWAGYVVCGSAVTITYVYAMLTPPRVGLNANTRVYFAEYSGSWLWSVWYEYACLVTRPMAWLFAVLGVDPAMGHIGNLLGVVLCAPPQCAAAVAGGLLARWLFAWRRKAASGGESDGQAPASSA